MATRPADWLLACETVVPAMEAYHVMPRDRTDDVAVFLCHGVQLAKVPTSPLALKMTPAHRRRYACGVCNRSFEMSERRLDLERLFAEDKVEQAIVIIAREGELQGWYEPHRDLTADELTRAADYEAGRRPPVRFKPD